MLKKMIAVTSFLALSSSAALAATGDSYHWTPPRPGQPICNSAFPGSLKVCYPYGSGPAGVVNLGSGLQFVLLFPGTRWKGVEAKKDGDPWSAIAVFRGNKMVSMDRNAPFFMTVRSVQVHPDTAHGGYIIQMIGAWKGGNAPDQYFNLTVFVAPDGKITVQH